MSTDLNFPLLTKLDVLGILQGASSLNGVFKTECIIRINSFDFYIHENSICHVKDGKFHNDKDPAIIENFYIKNVKHSIHHYYDKNLMHNEYGPAFIRFENGMETLKAFYKNGKLHNLNGPAIENLLEPINSAHYINGAYVSWEKFYSKDSEMIRSKLKLKEKIGKISK